MQGDFVVTIQPTSFTRRTRRKLTIVYINMEHSYMGDLVITFICPNGQSILVHGQEGAGTFGEPVDSEADPNTPGVGYDYAWSPDATNGTWGDNAGFSTAGTYQSTQSFTNLDGCPLNGVWQIEICDLLPSDNGFVFDACINFEIGCTDPSACNFDISATQDDGSCLEEDALGVCGGECPSDINSNVLMMPKSTVAYQFAENYNPLATDDDGSCILDDPGDSSCELVYDGNADGSVGADDLLGLLTEFGAECTPLSAFICGNPISYQGYDYATVLIGEQCWFTGNLRSENYENGDAIPSILSDSDWENLWPYTGQEEARVTINSVQMAMFAMNYCH